MGAQHVVAEYPTLAGYWLGVPQHLCKIPHHPCILGGGSFPTTPVCCNEKVSHGPEARSHCRILRRGEWWDY